MKFSKLYRIWLKGSVYLLVACLPLSGQGADFEDLAPSFALSEICNLENLRLNEPEKKATVQFLFQKDGRIVLQKTGKSWRSKALAFPESGTAQGDPRYPIAIFGKRLSRVLGFDLRRAPDGTETLVIPDVATFSSAIQRANVWLRKNNLEPIGYNLIEAGFLKPEELLARSLEGGETTPILFPFASQIKNLIPHEVSFHLGAIVLPLKDLQKARLINQKTLEAAQFIKSRRGTYGTIVDVIADSLITDRSHDFDGGLGNLIGNLALQIMGAGRDLGVENWFERLSGGTTAADTIVKEAAFNAIVATGKFEKLNKLYDELNERFPVNEPRVVVLRKSRTEATEFLKNLDKRIDELAQAFEATTN